MKASEKVEWRKIFRGELIKQRGNGMTQADVTLVDATKLNA